VERQLRHHQVSDYLALWTHGKIVVGGDFLAGSIEMSGINVVNTSVMK
jgi:hypothetical protein